MAPIPRREHSPLLCQLKEAPRQAPVDNLTTVLYLKLEGEEFGRQLVERADFLQRE